MIKGKIKARKNWSNDHLENLI